jgi:hypothetical protein
MSEPEDPAGRGQAGTQPKRKLSASALERLWSHGLHEDNMFLQRGSFFLVARSLLLVAYSGVLRVSGHARSSGMTASRVIAAFGLAVAVMWILTSYLHLSYVRRLRARVAAELPEFGDTRSSWLKSQPGWARRVDILVLIAYGVPALAGILWVMLLFLIS